MTSLDLLPEQLAFLIYDYLLWCLIVEGGLKLSEERDSLVPGLISCQHIEINNISRIDQLDRENKCCKKYCNIYTLAKNFREVIRNYYWAKNIDISSMYVDLQIQSRGTSHYATYCALHPFRVFADYNRFKQFSPKFQQIIMPQAC